MMTAVGVDGWRLLTTRDTAERLLLLAVFDHAFKARQKLDDALAARLMGGTVA